jgi:hypothetical protein
MNERQLAPEQLVRLSLHLLGAFCLKERARDRLRPIGGVVGLLAGGLSSFQFKSAF